MQPQLIDSAPRRTGSHFTAKTYLLKGAKFQLRKKGWYMIELTANLDRTQWGTAHLKLANKNDFQEVSFKLTNMVMGKRFFYVRFQPDRVTLSINSSAIACDVKDIDIFRVTSKFATKRVIKKVLKKSNQYQGLTTEQLAKELEKVSATKKVSLAVALSDAYDHTIFPPVYGRENNLKSFLDLGTPLTTGEFFGVPKIDAKVSVVLHAFYIDMLSAILGYLRNIPVNFYLIITTDTEEKKVHIIDYFKDAINTKISSIKVIVCSNQGRNIAPLLIDAAPFLQDSQYILHIHTKKSPYGNETEGWFTHCLEHLLESPTYVLSILDTLKNKNVGIVYPPPLATLREHLHWETMRPTAELFLKRLDIPPKTLDLFPLEFPAGSMFWFTTEALKPLLEANLSTRDFEEELNQRNGTLAHVIERLFLYITAHQGYSFKAIRPAPKDSYALPLTESFSGPRAIPLASEPKFSILIPAFNNWEITERCILSIIDYTSPEQTSFEILLADDASSDETRFALSLFPGIKHIRLEKNQGFLKNCNNAASFAKGDYLVLLNNDTQVQPDWLSALLAVFERNEDAGLVGSKLIYPDGTLQEAGGVIWSDATGLNYGGKDNPDLPQYSYVKHSDYISGAAICVPKHLWDTIGGFDERFTPAYYEDTDLAFSIRSLGYQCYFQPASLVIHYEGKSHGTDIQKGTKRYQSINHSKFLNKWKKTLCSEQVLGNQLLNARERSQGKKVIAVLDHFLPEYDRHAGARHTLCYVKELIANGYIVKYLASYIDDERQLKFAAYLQQLGVETYYPNIYHFEHNWSDWILAHKKYLSCVLINRPHIFQAHFQACETAGLPILYMCHDIHALRAYREATALGDTELAKRIKESEWKELEIFKQANYCYTPSLYELNYLKNEKNISNVAYIPLVSSDVVSRKQNMPSETKNVIFIGGMHHAPNKDAVIWFVTTVWPIVLIKHPDAKFRVIGKLPENHDFLSTTESVELLGGISEKELELEYLNAVATVAPLRFGAGVKGKTLETLQKGVPCVLTEIAGEGIPDLNEIIEHKDSSEAFAEELIRILSLESGSWLEVSNNYQDFFLNHFSTSLAWGQFKIGLRHIGLPH